MKLVRAASFVVAALVLDACSDAREVVVGTVGLQCVNCHGFPPPEITRTGQPHPTDTTCVRCHPSTVDGSGAIVEGGTHQDGKVDTCSACHGVPPPSGLHLATFHLSDGGCGTTCASCHPGYSIDPATSDLTTHINGTREARPITTNVAISEWPTGAELCSGCHGLTPPDPGSCTP